MFHNKAITYYVAFNMPDPEVRVYLHEHTIWNHSQGDRTTVWLMQYRLLCQNTLCKNLTPEVELCAVKLAIRVALYTL